MFVSGVSRYAYNYTYNPSAASYFSQDLTLVNQQLKNKDRPVTTLIVAANEKPFYKIAAEHHDNVTVISDRPTTQTPLTIVSHSAHKSDTFAAPDYIVTNSRSTDADRFYIYKSDKK
jgi:hypothetical protein